MTSHWATLYGCDFFAVEAIGGVGCVRVMVFFVIEFRTRAVHIAGLCVDPDGAWMQQVARHLLDPTDGFLRNATYLIHDRDPLFTAAWSTLLESEGVHCVPTPASSPNCNPHAERFVKTVRTECLDHFVIFGERHLRHLLREFAVGTTTRSDTTKVLADASFVRRCRRTSTDRPARFIACFGLADCSISIVAPRRDGRNESADTTGASVEAVRLLAGHGDVDKRNVMSTPQAGPYGRDRGVLGQLAGNGRRALS